MERNCKICHVTKPISEFYRDRDRFLLKCKDCIKKINAGHYLEVRETRLPKMREIAKDYLKNNRERCAEHVRKQRLKYPEKAKARVKLNNAVTAGKIIRQPCEVCGNPKSHGHHHDYSKPFDVKWLCSIHHAQEHYKIRQLFLNSQV